VPPTLLARTARVRLQQVDERAGVEDLVDAIGEGGERAVEAEARAGEVAGDRRDARGEGWSRPHAGGGQGGAQAAGGVGWIVGADEALDVHISCDERGDRYAPRKPVAPVRRHGRWTAAECEGRWRVEVDLGGEIGGCRAVLLESYSGAGGDVGDRERGEGGAQRQRGAGDRGGAGDERRGAERIAAEFEVFVVDADAVEPEVLGPQRGELRLERRTRRGIRAAGVGPAGVGGRRAARSSFLLAVSGRAASG
jgi:hypothetical protein